MVGGRGEKTAVAQQVEARIAGMRPPGGAVLHHAHDAGRARALEQVFLHRISDDRVVRGVDRGHEEIGGLAQRVARLLLEAARDLVHGDLRGDLALEVAAHPVRDDHEEDIAAIRVADAVLVALAVALAALLEDGEAHVRYRLGVCVASGREVATEADTTFLKLGVVVMEAAAPTRLRPPARRASRTACGSCRGRTASSRPGATRAPRGASSAGRRRSAGA